MMMENPNELIWNPGPLPDVSSTGPNSKILAWIVFDYPHSHSSHSELHGKFKYVLTVYPWENEFNSLAWRAQNKFTVGLNEKVTHWAWVIQDAKEPNVSWKANGL
jgi:hypothetical protein